MDLSKIGSHEVSRRGLITAAGVGAGLSLFPTGRASAAAATGLSTTVNALWSWNHMLADNGPRLTGNDAHRLFIDWLADKFQETGMTVHRDRNTFTRWAPRRWSLVVDGSPIDVAFYFPYSGCTPASGVTAQMIHLGVSPANAAGWALASGKIAVVEVPTPQLPIAAAFPPVGSNPSGLVPPLVGSVPGITDVAAAPLLELAAQAGVLGVICIRTGVSDAYAKNQYSPFTTAYADCPALWLGPTAGEQVRAKALLGGTATLTLDADLLPGAASDTIWALLPGSEPGEAVVVNTHTDGPNVAEENGGLGLLALAREFSRLPRSARKRSIIFVATTGHFQLPQFHSGTGPLSQSASRWMAAHPELWDGTVSKAVAALTLEHLGCMEWVDDPLANNYQATGLNDAGYCYTTTEAMRSIYLDSAAGTANTRTFAIAPPPGAYFGEGHDFYAQNIATMSLLPAMSYLVAAPADGAISKLDKNLLHGQVTTFAKAMRTLDTLTAAQIGTSLGV